MSQENNSETCRICGKPNADKYTWCRPCIKKAAQGAAKYFLIGRIHNPLLMNLLEDRDVWADLLRRGTNKWEKRFKRRLKRREQGPAPT